MTSRASLVAGMLALAAGAALGAGLATTPLPGSATRKPAVIERKTFDPQHLPTPAPPVTESENGACVAESSASANFDYQTISRKRTPTGAEATIRVQSVHVNLALKITIWLPKDSPEWLKEHEDLHLEITQRIYAGADKVAVAAAQRCAGQTFVGTGKDAAAAEHNALERAQAFLSEGYKPQADDAWVRVDQLFDDITMHGYRNTPGVKFPVEAHASMEKAFALFAKERAAATQKADASSSPSATAANSQSRR